MIKLTLFLQIAPERRVTVDELLDHPWVRQGYNRPVVWESKIDVKDMYICYFYLSMTLSLSSQINDIDADCIAELAHYHGVSTAAVTEKVLKVSYSLIHLPVFSHVHLLVDLSIHPFIIHSFIHSFTSGTMIILLLHISYSIDKNLQEKILELRHLQSNSIFNCLPL